MEDESFIEAKRFFSERGIADPQFFKGPSSGWRTRAKLAVQGTFDKPAIGLFKEGTHKVIDMPFCEDHHPKINEAIEKIRQFIKEKKIEPYHESSGTGLLRYLQFVVERSTGKIQLTFILNKDKEENLKFWELPDSGFWHSIWLNFNPAATNTILGSNWILIKGPELLWENLAGVYVCYHPASFTQANLELFEKMLISINKKIPKKSRIAEFYAGVGVIGLSLASKDRKIKCCEITPQAKMCFLEARSKLEKEAAANIEFHEGMAIQHLDLLQDADVVVVDPPRKGLDRKLLDELKEADHLEKLIYVSCGWKSFQRDCGELLEARWKLANAEIYLFFPGNGAFRNISYF